jgi:hypothetical protein
MPMQQSDWRKARRVLPLIGVITFALLVIASLAILKQPRTSMLIEVLREACGDRYRQAHSRGDSILVNAWVPRPELQRGRPFLRCMDLAAYR